MFEVEIDRSTCKGCGACTKTSQILYIDEENLVCMNGGMIDNNLICGFIRSIYDIEISASICPMNCFKIYDDDTGEEIEIERHSNI
ncbi:hypothetical protein [Methanosphaera sp. WGK6]|uniref:hypothetical protein n=1 Tax=Methanosphaera sp. WGK6 TaxID=1561964 RepID=UPI00084C98A8|nr:hypothetical protein [Methanosphaera sp. WGK6]OED29569.1 hypothetical protein NL43_07455 [Methanosphaera sp. WGK6]